MAYELITEANTTSYKADIFRCNCVGCNDVTDVKLVNGIF